MLLPGLKPPKIQFDGTGGALKHLASFHYAMRNWAVVSGQRNDSLNLSNVKFMKGNDAFGVIACYKNKERVKGYVDSPTRRGVLIEDIAVRAIVYRWDSKDIAVRAIICTDKKEYDMKIKAVMKRFKASRHLATRLCDVRGELSSLIQRRDEPVEEYIIRWQKMTNRVWKKEVTTKFNKKKTKDTFANTTEVKTLSPRTPSGGQTRRTVLKPESEQGFFNRDLPVVLKHFLTKNTFTLPESQRPEQVSKDKEEKGKRKGRRGEVYSGGGIARGGDQDDINFVKLHHAKEKQGRLTRVDDVEKPYTNVSINYWIKTDEVG
ncbi:hypothetical protein ACLOJK_037005 [Asimina triloba]